MIHNIIIRGQKDGGKTTTCITTYKDLLANARYSKLFTMSRETITEI